MFQLTALCNFSRYPTYTIYSRSLCNNPGSHFQISRYIRNTLTNYRHKISKIYRRIRLLQLAIKQCIKANRNNEKQNNLPASSISVNASPATQSAPHKIPRSKQCDTSSYSIYLCSSLSDALVNILMYQEKEAERYS